MDATAQRSNGFVFPDDEEDEQPPRRGGTMLAVPPRLVDLIANQQEQIKAAQQLVAQGQQMMTALMMQVQQLQLQHKRPVIHTAMNELVGALPKNFVANAHWEQVHTPDGGYAESLTVTSDPRNYFEGLSEVMHAQAELNRSMSTRSRYFGK